MIVVLSLEPLVIVRNAPAGVASSRCYLCEDYEVCFDSPLPN